MVAAGLSPSDPARWWLSVVAERERQEQDDAQSPHTEQDVQVLDP